MFAPIAAHLAAGLPVADVGPRLDPATLVRLELPLVDAQDGLVRGVVIALDHFGNVQLSIRPSDLERAGIADRAELEASTPGRSVRVLRARTFADFPEHRHGLIVDSSGWLALVLNGVPASLDLGVVAGDRVTLSAPGPPA